jgi:hypothetical protein
VIRKRELPEFLLYSANKSTIRIYIIIVVCAFVYGCAGITSPQFGSSPLLITSTAAIANAQGGTQFHAALNATGGILPYHWKVATGALPAGLSLNANTGVISGMPMNGGNSIFSVQVSDSSVPSPQSATKSISLAVLVFALQIIPGGLPNGQVGTSFQAALRASGGVTPYTWSVIGSLPAGLGLNSASGAITGTPTQPGAEAFGIQVTDAAQNTVATSLNAIVAPVGIQPLAIVASPLPQATAEKAYSATLQATGGTPPYSWKIQSGLLPIGLSLSTDGQITGMPTTASQSSFAVQVTDSTSTPFTATETFSLAALAPIALDQYGGDANHSCTGVMKNGGAIPGTSGYFYLYLRIRI